MECIYSSVREISVRKMTVEKGSASRGMIVVCGRENRWKQTQDMFLNTRPSIRCLNKYQGLNHGQSSSHLALTCIHTEFKQVTSRLLHFGLA